MVEKGTKRKLSGEEFLALKKRLKAEKVQLNNRIRFELFEKSAGYQITNHSNDALTVALLHEVILYALLGDSSPFKTKTWCSLRRAKLFEKVSIVCIENFGLGDYLRDRDQFDDSLNRFEQKLVFRRAGDLRVSLAKELSLVAIPVRQRDELKSKYGKIGVALSFEKTLEKIKVVRDAERPVAAELEQQACDKLDLLLSFEELCHEGFASPQYRVANSKRDFRSTKIEYEPVTNRSPMFAIDCEMCLVKNNTKAVTRISIVNENEETVYDTFVKPSDEIIDYLTQYSGIDRDTLVDCEVTLERVQRKIARLLPNDAILVGHSLKFDLNALKMMHPYVIDTSVVYNVSGMRHVKPSLKMLTKKFLGLDIQSGSHCSIEDASAAMQLVKLKLAQGLRFGDRTCTAPANQSKKNFRYFRNLSYFLTKRDDGRTAIVGRDQFIRDYQSSDNLIGFGRETNSQIKTQTCTALEKDFRNVITAFEFDKSDNAAPDASTSRKINKYLKKIWKRIADRKSICIVLIGGDRDDDCGCFIRLSDSCDSVQQP